jgi:hypothetical protein
MAASSPDCGFPTIPFVDPLIASFAPDPSLYGASLDPSGAFWTVHSVGNQEAFGMDPSSSGMMPGLPPWDPNVADPVSLGHYIDLDTTPMNIQTLYQQDVSMGDYSGGWNPHDYHLGTDNWQG